MKKYFLTLLAFSFLAFYSFAQIPNGYYDDAGGLSGAQLKTALRNIIDNHNDLSYSALWTAFQETDVKSNGKVWDMYSDVPGGTPAYEYTFITDQCGNYSGEGSCYNREHSFPKSWFNDGYPMYTDMFHLVPTDGYVNGKRSNYPFGEVGSATWTSTNGSKLGSSSYPGYSGTVFEPIDEYKGDFARGYFYMATRYESNISGWSSPMLASNSFPAFTEWALNLLMDWHEQDPVSQKEIDRNNAIYSYQNNRNPFIDHPEYVNIIWGDGTTSVSFTTTPSTDIMAGDQYTYNVTATGGNGNPITITCPQKPAWLSFTGGSNGSATLSGTPSESDEGVHSILLSATDGESTVEQSFSITVEVIPTSLIFTSTPVTSALVNQQYSYTIGATVEGDESAVISFQGITIPAWLNFTDQGNGSAILYGTPAEENIGNNSVQVKAISGELETSQSFNIQVSSGGSGTEFIETFTLIPENSTSSYITRDWTGDNSIQWSATNARTDQEIDGRAICLKDLADSYLLSQTLSGGVSTVSFQHQQKFTGSGGEITLYINNQQVGDPITVSTDAAESTFSNINVSGDFTIKLVSNGLSRIAIDNLAWTNVSTPPQSPVFGEISHSPTNPATSETVTFTAVVTDPDGTVELVKLLFGNSSSSLDQNISMSNSGENTYTVSSEMPLNLGDVYYKVEATDNEGNKSVSPQFVINSLEIKYTLQVEIVGDGAIVVNGNPYTEPINFVEGTIINLSANPNPGFLFDGWSGDVTSSQASESIEMTSNKTITATFIAEPQPPVIVEVTHTPSNPMADEVVSFTAEVIDNDGTVVEVLLRYGNTSGSYTQITTMSLVSVDFYTLSSVMPLDQGDVYYVVEATDNDDNTTTSSEFTISAPTPQYELEITIVGEGDVTVNGDLYTEPVLLDEGTLVSLVASPSEGYQFDGWSGDLTSSDESESITMEEDKSVTATFSLISGVDQNSLQHIALYPNPFSSFLTIENFERVHRITFTNVLGQNTLIINNPEGVINTGKLPKGLYLITIENLNGDSVYRKVVKE